MILFLCLLGYAIACVFYMGFWYAKYEGGCVPLALIWPVTLIYKAGRFFWRLVD